MCDLKLSINLNNFNVSKSIRVRETEIQHAEMFVLIHSEKCLLYFTNIEIKTNQFLSFYMNRSIYE